MKVLFIYPEFLVTFWSWKHLLRFVGKKAAFPPLGLLTIAGMMPENWQMKLVDVNVRRPTDKDIKWADYIFVSAMITQSDSAKEVIACCKKLGKTVILGGPILESGIDEFPDVDCFFLGEAEDTLPKFVADLEAGRLERVYKAATFPNLAGSKRCRWDLIKVQDYASMLLQRGRGCPLTCTFCSVAAINGRRPRVRPDSVFFADLEAIYEAGYRGGVLLADDNIIGNKPRAKEMLRLLAAWQKDRGYPFNFTGEFPITLADDPELMKLLVEAGFGKVFLGLETPNEASLRESHKLQNVGRNLIADVGRIQKAGLVVLSGFMVGFDNDDPDSFADQMIEFIQQTGIFGAMVGVLQAQPKTSLHDRLEKEGRLLSANSGNNTTCEPNFVPKMPVRSLVAGFKKIVTTIYSPREYYKTIRTFLENYNPSERPKKKLNFTELKALAKAVWHIGLFGGRQASYYFWKTLAFAARNHPGGFSEAVAAQIYGTHFREVAEGINAS